MPDLSAIDMDQAKKLLLVVREVWELTLLIDQA